MSPIGVFDSGLGGFGVSACIREQLPDESILYLGDVAHRPFGPLPAAEVARHTRAAEAFLAGQGCRAWVIACNTASVVAGQLRGLLPVVEMVTPAVTAAAALEPRSVGVLGTLGTVHSCVHERALAAAIPGVRVVGHPCEEALRLAEAGGGDDPARLRALLSDCLAAIVGCDVTILACTDFTAVRATLDEVNAGRTVLVDPAEAAARQLVDLLNEREPGPPRHRFCLTAPDPAFARVGRDQFGLPIDVVELVAA